MIITICGSMVFAKEMRETKAALEALGHEVLIPPLEVPDKNGNMISVEEFHTIRKSASDDEAWVWDLKEQAIKRHFDKVAQADAVLILNIEKKNIPGYIGANTFLEMGLAFHLGKKIFLLNDVPEVDFREELLGMRPVVIGGDVSQI